MHSVNPDFHWLVGLFEGEGTFIPGAPSQPRRASVIVVTTDEDVIARAAKLMGTSYFERKRKTAPAHWKPIFEARLRGGAAVRFMDAVRPYMGARRQVQIDRATACVNRDEPRLKGGTIPVLDK